MNEIQNTQESTPSEVKHCSCHCGAVEFEAAMPISMQASRCNCSICAIKGAVMVYIPLGNLTVIKGEEALKCYSFNTGIAKHHFCSNCGIHCFHQPRSDPSKFAVNAACIKGMDIYTSFPDLNVNDGVHHQKDNGGKVRSAGRLRFEVNQEE